MKRFTLTVAVCAALSGCDGATIDALVGPGACFGSSDDDGEMARPADAVVETFGMKTTAGADAVLTRERLAELGVRYILLGYESDRTITQMLAKSLGLRGLVTVERAESIVPALQFFAGLATAIAYRNNDPVVGDWGDRVRATQRQLWETVKSDAATRTIDVVGPNVESDEQIAAAGDLSAWVDYGTCFPYRGAELNQPPGARAESDLVRHASVYPGKRYFVPQVGYHTSADGVSEAVQAKYLTRTLLEHSRLGIERTFILELDDSVSERKFGLVRSDSSQKPSFTALRRLIEQLTDPGPAFVPRKLSFALTGAPPDVRHLLLQKRNRTFYLALWREITSVDADAAAAVTLELARPARSLKAYAPLAQAAPTSIATGRSLPLTISDAPTIVAIEPECD